MNEIKLLIRTLLAGIPILLVIATVNYVVDPALAIRNSNYEELIAQGLLEGKNAAIDTNYDERKLQRQIISNLEKPYDGVVLGSSRIMSIPCETLGFDKGFNNGVSGAVIEDIIGIVGMYGEADLLPATVAIGIDFWLFNENHGDTRWLELLSEYNAFAETVALETVHRQSSAVTGQLQWIEQLFSPSYFQASLIKIRMSPAQFISTLSNMDENTPRPILSYNILADRLNKLPDGSIIYSEETSQQTEDAINQSVISVINSGTLYHSEDYTQLSPRIIDQFVGLIDYLEGNNVTVVFIVPPLHPMIYDHIIVNSKYRMLLETEAYVRDFARGRGITVIGSVNPDAVGAANTDFYDFMHPTREFMAELCAGKLNAGEE